MESNSNPTNRNLKENIYSRIAKAKAITTCILLLRDYQAVTPQAWHDIIWAIDGYLEDLMVFYNKLDEVFF